MPHPRRPRLPVELLRMIISFVNDDTETLLDLLITSKCIHTLTEPILYANVRFIEREMGGCFPTWRLKAFYGRIKLSNGRLARLVKRLTLLVDWSMFLLQDEMWLAKILKRVVNLEYFVFDYLLQRMHCDKTLSALCRNRASFSLKRFTWTHTLHWRHTDLLADFLESQTSLEHLALLLIDDAIPLSERALPHLRVLEAGLIHAIYILPGRYVTHFDVVFLSETVTDELVLPITNELRNIRVFKGQGTSSRMVALASYMFQLEYMELETSEPLDATLRYLNGLASTTIRYLRIRPSFELIPDDGYASKLFDSLPTLEYVEIERVIGVFKRWHRHSEGSILIQRPSGWDWLCSWENDYQVFNSIGWRLRYGYDIESI